MTRNARGGAGNPPRTWSYADVIHGCKQPHVYDGEYGSRISSDYDRRFSLART